MGPPDCRWSLLGSSRAHPPHLRLAPGPVVPPRGDARPPGGVRRPPARGRRRPRRSTWSSSPATSTTGRCPRSTPSGSPTRPSPGWPPRGPGSSRPAATTTPPSGSGFGSRLIDAAGVFLRTDAGARRHAGAARRRRTVRSRSTACPTSTPTPCASRGSCRVRSPRGRPRRGDAAGPRRPRPASRGHPVGGAGPRVRRRGRAQRLRARHQRRRRLAGPDPALRRRRLHRARPPARPADPDRDGPLQRLAAGLLLLRGRPRQGLAGWSTSTAEGFHDADFVAAPVPRRARPAPRRPRRPAGRPGARRRRGRLGAGDAHRRRAAAPADGAAAGAGSRTPCVLAFEPTHPAPGRRPGRAGCAAAPTTTSRSTSSPTCAASPRQPTTSPRCSSGACDACGDDPDVDLLLTEA